MTGQPDRWQRLDPRMLAVLPLRQVGRFLPLLVLVILLGSGDASSRATGLIAAVLVLVSTGVARWFTTRYRVTTELVELHSGVLVRSHRSVRTERVRTVDVTASPLHRVFGLSVLRIGTGQHIASSESGELTLDAVSTGEADRLRGTLLERDDAPAGLTPGGAGGSTIARWDPRWLRYAPLTVSSLLAVAAVLGGLGQLVGELDIDPATLPGAQDVRAAVDRVAVWIAGGLLAVAVLLVALLGSVLIFLEVWWRYHLTREPDATFRVRRGLLTTRSVSLERRRLRGVELAEPLLLRAGRGARLTAVATGLGRSGQAEGRAGLLPPAPRTEAHRVAAGVLDQPHPPTATGLTGHPPAALRRRLVRALLPVLLVVAGLWAAMLLSAPVAGVVPAWAPWAVLGLGPLAALLAVDAYRNLGHALTRDYLVTRSGVFVRRSVALQRSGVIGWTVSQSALQRRAGLMTLTAVTAAGSGGYRVLDVGVAEGLSFAERAVPGLLGPVLTGTRPAPARPGVARG